MTGLKREDGPGAGAGTGVLAVEEGSTGSCLSLRPVTAKQGSFQQILQVLSIVGQGQVAKGGAIAHVSLLVTSAV